MNRFLERFFIDFGSVFPFWEPSWSQVGTKLATFFSPRRPKRPPRCLQDAPQEAQKLPPRCLQIAYVWTTVCRNNWFFNDSTSWAVLGVLQERPQKMSYNSYFNISWFWLCLRQERNFRRSEGFASDFNISIIWGCLERELSFNMKGHPFPTASGAPRIGGTGRRPLQYRYIIGYIYIYKAYI